MANWAQEEAAAFREIQREIQAARDALEQRLRERDARVRRKTLEAVGRNLLNQAAGSINLNRPQPPVLTTLQADILDALDGKALTKAALSHAINCGETTLYRAGGIKELVEQGRVMNDRKVGGYYRPDRPPPAA